MKINYLPTFIKDIKSLKSTSSYSVVKSLVFTDILAVRNLKEISNLKKLKGDDNAYRKILPYSPQADREFTG
ncbi:MAG: addiction module toxin RelE [Snowella sp.]|jgi:mRNA interferase RelE/StbE|nr:MAG: addiction module toxin RelE [Snowella sp.]